MLRPPQHYEHTLECSHVLYDCLHVFIFGISSLATVLTLTIATTTTTTASAATATATATAKATTTFQ